MMRAAHRIAGVRFLIAAGAACRLLLAESYGQADRPYDPQGLSARPRRSESSRSSDWTVSPRPSSPQPAYGAGERFTPLVFRTGDRFYNLSFPENQAYSTSHYEAWLRNFRSARAERTGFGNLDQYDMWFRNIPGAGREFASNMKDAYVEGMPPNVRKEYEKLMLERKAAEAGEGGPVEGPRGKEVEVRSVTQVGDRYVAMVGDGRIISEGDLVSTRCEGWEYTWRAEYIGKDGTRFTCVGKRRTQLLTPKDIVYLAAAAGGLALALVAGGGWFFLRRRAGASRPRRAQPVPLPPPLRPAPSAPRPERFPAVANVLSIASLVLGILGLLTPFAPGAVPLAVPAVVCGHVARGRRRPGTGDSSFRGIALAGVIIGYVGLGLIAMVVTMFSRPMCAQNLRRIRDAKEAYIVEHRRAPDRVADLVPEHLNAVPRCPAFGWYTVNPEGMDPECSFPGHQMDTPPWACP